MTIIIVVFTENPLRTLRSFAPLREIFKNLSNNYLMHKMNQNYIKNRTNRFSTKFSTILIVEDSETLANIIQKKLQLAGLHTEICLSGNEAIDKIINKRFDNILELILLDYRLLDMTGEEFLKKLKKQGYEIPFIIITGYGNEKIAVDMMKLGAKDYIIKNEVFIDFLPTAVKRVLNQLITEKKLAEAQKILRETQEQYKSIIENTQDAIMLTLADGTISYMSSACEKVLGYKPEDLVGQLPHQFKSIHKDDIEKIEKLYYLALRGESGRDFEYRIITKSGETKWISHSWTPIFRDDKLYMVMSILRDITERKQAIKEIHKAQHFTKTVIESLRSGLIVIDLEGNILDYNSKAIDILGVDIKKCNSIQELLSYDEFTEKRNVRKNIHYKKIDSEEIIIGLSTSNHLDEHNNHKGFIINFQDITQIKEIEKKLKEQERLSMIGKLAANISHEIRNPLATIKLTLQVLSHNIERFSLEKKLEYLTRTINEINRLNCIIKDTLMFARSSELKLTSVNLNELCNELLEEVQMYLAKKNIKFTLQLDEKISNILADKFRLKQILINLIINAEEAIEELTSGHIELHTKLLDSKFVCINIMDNGCGMDKKTMDRIFEPFYTTKGSGTGLGLAICQQIIEQFNGYITLESELAKGTNVMINIPIFK